MFEKLEELAKNNKKISDFHIRTGSPLAYRQTGEICTIKEVIIKRTIYLWTALIIGMFLGLIRIMEGGHFISDVVFSGLIIFIFYW